MSLKNLFDLFSYLSNLKEEDFLEKDKLNPSLKDFKKRYDEENVYILDDDNEAKKNFLNFFSGDKVEDKLKEKDLSTRIEFDNYVKNLTKQMLEKGNNGANIFLLRAGYAMKIKENEKNSYFIDVSRNEETLKSSVGKTYKGDDKECHIEKTKNHIYNIFDPMLATGGSILTTINMIKEVDEKAKINVYSILGTLAGIEKIKSQLNGGKVKVGCLLSGLNKKGYIIGKRNSNIFGAEKYISLDMGDILFEEKPKNYSPVEFLKKYQKKKGKKKI